MALVIHPTYELYEKKHVPFCSSLQVAETFEKRHADVLRDIKNLSCSTVSNQRNFAPVENNAALSVDTLADFLRIISSEQAIPTKKAKNVPCTL